MALLKATDTKFVDMDGKTYEVRTLTNGSKLDIYVDDKPANTYSQNFFLAAFGDLNDYAFEIAGHPAILAMRYGKFRIAIDGKYTDNGDPFRPVLPLPRWGSAFFILNIGAPFMFSGKIWDYLFSAGCGYVCTHYILKNPDLKADAQRKVIYCVLITLFSWAMFVLFNWANIQTILKN